MGSTEASKTRVLDEPDDGERYRFAAFISYRHVDPDRRWARWLHSTLETYRVPKRLALDRNLPRRLGRLFKDEDELQASTDLSKEIEAALRHSRYLIVVCSPRTPASEWVNREVVRFRELGRGDQILALLIEGSPTESFPRALVEIRPNADTKAPKSSSLIEPLAVDVRPDDSMSRRQRARWARLRFAARLLGVTFDDLRQREKERRRRRLAASALIASAAVTLVLTAGVASTLAFNFASRAAQEEQRVRDRDRSLAEAQQAVRRRRADGFVTRAFDQPEGASLSRALPLLAKALEVSHGDSRLEPNMRALVGTALQSIPTVVELSRDTSPKLAWDRLRRGVMTTSTKGTTVGPDGVSATWDGTELRLSVVEVRAGTRTQVEYPPYANPDPLTMVSFAPNGLVLLGGGNRLRLVSFQLHPPWKRMKKDDPPDEAAVIIWQDAAPPLEHESEVISATLSVESSGAWTVTTVSAEGLRRRWSLPLDAVAASIRGVAGWELSVVTKPHAVSANGNRGLCADEDGYLFACDLRSGETLSPALTRQSQVTASAISPNGEWIATCNLANEARLWHLPTNQAVLLPHDQLVNDVLFSPDGQRLLTCAGRFLHMWRLPTGEPLTFPIAHADQIVDAAFSPEGRRIVTATHDAAQVWDAETGIPLSAPLQASALEHVYFSPGGDRVIGVGSNYVEAGVQVWDIRPDPRPFPVLVATAELFAANRADAVGGLWRLTADECIERWRVVSAQAENDQRTRRAALEAELMQEFDRMATAREASNDVAAADRLRQAAVELSATRFGDVDPRTVTRRLDYADLLIRLASFTRARAQVAACNAAIAGKAVDKSIVARAAALAERIPKSVVETHATRSSASASEQFEEYRVRQGDTLFSIARRYYGNGNRWQLIVSMNPGVSPATLHEGQVLKLSREVSPSPATRQHPATTRAVGPVIKKGTTAP